MDGSDAGFRNIVRISCSASVRQFAWLRYGAYFLCEIWSTEVGERKKRVRNTTVRSISYGLRHTPEYMLSPFVCVRAQMCGDFVAVCRQGYEEAGKNGAILFM